MLGEVVSLGFTINSLIYHLTGEIESRHFFTVLHSDFITFFCLVVNY